MGGQCILLSHWHGGDPPATLDLDTERWKKYVFHVFMKLEESKKTIVTLAEIIVKTFFLALFLKIIVGPTVALQAGNKTKTYVSDLSHFCPIFPLS